MEIRRNQNLGFGTAFVRFNQARLNELSEQSRDKVIKFLTKDVRFVQISDDFIHSAQDGTVKRPFSKYVATSFETDNTGLHFTHENLKKELQLMKIFNKLFDNKGITTEIIENFPENSELIEEKKNDLQGWVLAGNKRPAISRQEAYELAVQMMSDMVKKI